MQGELRAGMNDGRLAKLEADLSSGSLSWERRSQCALKTMMEQ